MLYLRSRTGRAARPGPVRRSRLMGRHVPVELHQTRLVLALLEDLGPLSRSGTYRCDGPCRSQVMAPTLGGCRGQVAAPTVLGRQQEAHSPRAPSRVPETPRRTCTARPPKEGGRDRRVLLASGVGKLFVERAQPAGHPGGAPRAPGGVRCRPAGEVAAPTLLGCRGRSSGTYRTGGFSPPESPHEVALGGEGCRRPN